MYTSFAVSSDGAQPICRSMLYPNGHGNSYLLWKLNLRYQAGGLKLQKAAAELPILSLSTSSPNNYQLFRQEPDQEPPHQLKQIYIAPDSSKDIATDNLILINQEQKIIRIDKATAQLFGYDPAELAGAKLNLLIPEQPNLTFNCCNSSNNNEHAPAQMLVFYGLKANGTLFLLQGSIQGISITGQTHISLSTYQQPSAQISNEPINNTGETIIQRDESLRQFENVVSHKLRGPLATILGLIPLLKKKQAQSEHDKQILNYLEQSAHKLDEIVHDLQRILEHEYISEQQNEECCLEELIAELGQEYKEQLTQTAATLTVDLSKANQLWCNKQNLYNILKQLLDNALAFRQPNLSPIITISSVSTAHQTTITFADNGTGIDLLENRHKVFTPYSKFQLDTTGKGLGLYFVQAMLQAMGGTIDIESKIGRGTTFYISLPN